MLLVLEVQDAPWWWFEKNQNMSELTLYLYIFFIFKWFKQWDNIFF